MPIRYHAQRKHIISSLESLLYQLYTLSFFLAPSLWAFLCRCGTQFQFSRARDFDDGRWSLRFWFALIMLVNTGSLWTHASVGVPSGRGVVLDFVGIGRPSSKFQLLLLDFTIILLQAVLTTISYETSLTIAMPADTPDPLMPPTTYTEIPLEVYDEFTKDTSYNAEREGLMQGEPKRVRDANPFQYPPRPTTASPSSTEQTSYFTSNQENTPSSSQTTTQPPKTTSSSYLPPREPIVNLRLRHLVHRLTSPTPIPPPSEEPTDNLGDLALPLPAGAGGLARTIRILAQANVRRQMRLRMAEVRARGAANAAGAGAGAGAETGRRETRANSSTNRSNDPNDTSDANVRFPGGMYSADS